MPVFTWEKNSNKKFYAWYSRILNEWKWRRYIQTDPENSDFDQLWILNFGPYEDWEEDRSRRKKTDEKKSLKRRTKNKHNAFIRQSFGGQPRQLVGVRTLKVGEYNTRIKAINENVRTFWNSPPACVGRTIIEIHDTKATSAETFIFTPSECLQFASLVESDKIVLSERRLEFVVSCHCHSELLLLISVWLPLLLRLPI